MLKKIIVIKLGGSSLQNSATVSQLATLVRGYQKRRYRVVVVHGGGPAINAELTRQKISWQFINGQRQTTPEMMCVIDQVLAGNINSGLVSDLQKEKVSAIGLSGAEAKILFCEQANPELMCVGKVTTVNTVAIDLLLMQFGAKVPVIAPIGYGINGEKFNVNADWAAAQIAMSLNAKKLIFLTDQNGILSAEKQLVPRTTSQLIENMIAHGTIAGGMFTKVNAMMTALNAGVKHVRVLNAGFASHALSTEPVGTLLTNVRTKASKPIHKGVIHERAS